MCYTLSRLSERGAALAKAGQYNDTKGDFLFLKSVATYLLATDGAPDPEDSLVDPLFESIATLVGYDCVTGEYIPGTSSPPTPAEIDLLTMCE